MSEIIKTWPAFMDARTVEQIFSPKAPPFSRYYFTLGRGKPKDPPAKIWFTWRGRILGWFEIETIVCNDGTLPQLSRLDGEPSEWQIRKDAWVAVCKPPCQRIRDRVYMSGFRGWRYFNIESYRGDPESRFRI